MGRRAGNENQKAPPRPHERHGFRTTRFSSFANRWFKTHIIPNVISPFRRWRARRVPRNVSNPSYTYAGIAAGPVFCADVRSDLFFAWFLINFSRRRTHVSVFHGPIRSPPPRASSSRSASPPPPPRALPMLAARARSGCQRTLPVLAAARCTRAAHCTS